MDDKGILELEVLARNFPVYAQPQTLGLYLARYELFKKVIHIPGHIIEGGVAWGGGLLWWAQMSYLFEHMASTRQIIGFDVFNNEETFIEASAEDATATRTEPSRDKVYPSDLDHLTNVCESYQRTFFRQPRLFLVVGNAVDTIPKWCEANAHATIAVLNIHFDTYAPTVTALTHFVPRMPKGGIVIISGYLAERFPGMSKALIDTIGIASVRLKRFPWCQSLTWFEIE